jgi:hypothetical protein
MVRVFIFAATLWVFFMGYGLIAEHQSFWQTLKGASIIGGLVLIVPFLPRGFG